MTLGWLPVKCTLTYLPLDALYNPHATSVSGFYKCAAPIRSEEGSVRLGLRATRGRVDEEGGHEVKNARSLVVASNWNTILTPKPKIGEYSSRSLPTAPFSLLFLNSSFFRESFWKEIRGAEKGSPFKSPENILLHRL